MLTLNKLRYSKWFSNLVRHPLRLLVSGSDSFNNQIRKKIKINGGNVTYYGYNLRFPPGVGMGILSNLYWKRERGFEESTGRLLIQLFKLNSVYLDIGSNFGFYSVLAKKVNAAIEVFAFEPFGVMVKQNELFRACNEVSYTLIPKGVSDVTKEEEFFVPEMSDREKEVSTASFQKDFFFNTKYGSTSMKVECLTLDSFFNDSFKDSKRIRPLCLKIDVEGHEMAVLKGSENFLMSVRPMCVIEIDQRNAANALEFFQRTRFAIFHIQPFGLVKFSDEDFLADFKKTRDFFICPIERIKRPSNNFIPYNNFTSAFE